jgi:cytochrome c5
MRTTLAALSLAAGLGIVTCQTAAALPVAPDAIQQTATATTAVQQAQYTERRGKGTITKCYRDFVVGSYSCHTYRTQ